MFGIRNRRDRRRAARQRATLTHADRQIDAIFTPASSYRVRGAYPESEGLRKGGLTPGVEVTVARADGLGIRGTVTWVGYVDSRGGYPFWLAEFPGASFDSDDVIAVYPPRTVTA